MNEIIKETYKASHFESETSRGNRRYLPLTVWAKKGFDTERIEQIDDKKWDEEMQCFMYGATVRSKVNEQGNKEEWNKEIGGETQPKPSAPHANSETARGNRQRGLPQTKDEEDKKKKKEREKEQKDNEKMGKMIIEKVSGPLFTVKQKMQLKNFKCIPVHAQEILEDMKKKLELYVIESDKACSGKLTKFSVDKKEVCDTVAQATSAINMVNTMLQCADTAGWTEASAKGSGGKGKKGSRKNARAKA